MLQPTFFDFCEETKSTLLFYRGLINQDLIVNLGAFLRTTLEGPLSTQKLVFSVFVEMAHNVLHHGEAEVDPANNGQTTKKGMFLITQSADYYNLSAGNLISKAAASATKSRLNAISGLNKGALRLKYRQMRSSGEARHQLGAGLGLLEMAKRADKPLEYAFHHHDDGLVVFTLTVSISKKGPL